jgi:hypothetical protein
MSSTTQPTKDYIMKKKFALSLAALSLAVAANPAYASSSWSDMDSFSWGKAYSFVALLLPAVQAAR